MLKGQTELILTDVRTGSQEKVLEHNMVHERLRRDVQQHRTAAVYIPAGWHFAV